MMRRAGMDDALLALSVIGILALMVVRLPPAALDLLLAFSITLSVLVLLASLYVERPLELSTFPSVLLLATLLRLGLNIASTRLILMEGDRGAAAAGRVIESFGRFAVGGNVVVGAVVFLLLVVVNFTVITKGAGRIAEVAARFTLDAMPGKQMSIDAELAAGAIDEREAKSRRRAVEQEADFYGAMDGASKFVRGDAVAGLLITAINIVGGLLIGVLQKHMDLPRAAEVYTLLTVGDGLVTQVPALLVSTAAGVVMSRASSPGSLAGEVGAQLFLRPRALAGAAAALGALSLLPGVPMLPFAGLAAAAYALSRRARPAAPARAPEEAPAPEKVEHLIPLEVLELEVGFGLIGLVDASRGGDLAQRIVALRRQFAQELGIVVPVVHIRDNLTLAAGEYRIVLRGVEVARAQIHADRLLAMDPGGAGPAPEGIAGKEPAFGLPCVWIERARRAEADGAGFTVVEPSAVVITHLAEVLRLHAHELLGRQELSELLAICGKENAKVVEDVIPGVLPLGDALRVLKQLLREQVSIRDLRSVLEALADAAPQGKDPYALAEAVRRRLARQITARLADKDGALHVAALARPLEEALRASLAPLEGEMVLAPDVETGQRVVAALARASERMAAAGRGLVLLAPADLRRPLREFTARFHPDVAVLAHREIAPKTKVVTDHTVELEPTQARAWVPSVAAA